MKLTLRLLGCLALILTVACGNEARPDDAGRDGRGGEDGAALDSIKKVIGPDGGSIAIDAASLDFPPGALSSDQEISVSELSEADVAPLPAGAAFASPPVAFEPHGLDFEAPVSVNLIFGGGVGKRFVVAKLDDREDETWEKGADAEFQDGKATFTINGFSIWAVVDDVEGALDGESGSGGSGGGTGGSGGSGGSDGPSGPGAFETTALSGIVTLENEFDTITSHNVDTATGLPYCVQGLAPADPEGDALVGLKFDLGETGSNDDDFAPSGDGLIFALDTPIDAELEVTLHTTLGGVYCKKDYFVPGSNFVAWDDFSVDCDDEGIMPVYDAETEVIDAITMFAVPLTDGAGRAFEFCVNDFDDSYFGYRETADFHGYISSYQGGDAILSHVPEGTDVSREACVGGNSDTGVIGLTMNLAESVEGVLGDYPLESEGLLLSLYTYDDAGSGDLWAYIDDGTTEWCAAFPFNAGHWNSPYFIPWTSFNTVCGGGGAQFGGADLRTIRVTRESAATSFNLCLYDAIDTTAAEVGLFLGGDTWHGYPEASAPTANVSLETNFSWERSSAHACMRGTVNAATTDSAKLLIPLNQATPGGVREDVLPAAELLQYRIDRFLPLTDEAEAVVVGEDNQDYCAPLADAYEQSIPWADFRNCATGLGLPVRVKSVGVRISSDAVADTPFDLCIYTLGELADVPQ